MAVYIALGETIEGLKVDCTVRRWEWKGQRRHPLTGKRMTLYVTDRNSWAEIVESAPEPTEEDLKEATRHFHRIVGDRLEADSLSVYVAKSQKIEPDVKEGVTARHGANLVNLRCHSIAEIRTSLDMLRKALELSGKQLKS